MSGAEKFNHRVDPTMPRADVHEATVSMVFLYADTGGGHRASALAVKQAIERRCGDGVRVAMIDPTKRNRSLLIRTSDTLYSRCIRSAPWLWAGLFHASNHRSVTWLLRRTVLRSLGASTTDAAGDESFDVVVSFHPLLSHAARQFADRTGSAAAVTVVTDLLDPHASWAHRGMDAVFVPNGSSAAALVRHGVPAQKCHTVGLPVGSQFTDPVPTEVSEPVVAPGLFRVLLIGGGEGAGGLYRKAAALLRRCPDVEVHVIAGRNHRLLQRLVRLEPRHPGRLRAVGFVDDMATWMRSADLVVTKAGPGAIAEALAVGTPLLITGHLRGQERRNPEFVTIGRAGLRARRRWQLVSRVRDLEANPDLLEHYRCATRLLSRPHAASDIAEQLVGLAHVGRPIESTSRLHRFHLLASP